MGGGCTSPPLQQKKQENPWVAPMSGWEAPAPHTPATFCRPLGLPNRKSGTNPSPRNVENHEFAEFGHFVKRNQKSPRSEIVRDTFPVISVTSTLYQLPYREQQVVLMFPTPPTPTTHSNIPHPLRGGVGWRGVGNIRTSCCSLYGNW